MRKSAVPLLLVTSSLSAGQMCGIPPRQGIPEGLYIGDSTCDGKGTTMGLDGTTTEDLTPTTTIVTKKFGTSGIELTAQGTPLARGDFKPFQFGLFSGENVVNFVTLGDNRLVIGWDVFILISDPEHGTLTFTGTDIEIFTFSPPNSVVLDRTLLIASDSVDGETFILETKCSATLVR